MQPDHDDAGFYPLNIIVTDKAGATDTFRLILQLMITTTIQSLTSRNSYHDDTKIYKFAGDTVIFDVDAVDPDIAVFGDQINFEILSGLSGEH